MEHTQYQRCNKTRRPLWHQWYDQVLELKLKGTSNLDISTLLKKPVRSITKVVNLPDFSKRLKSLDVSIGKEEFQVLDGITHLNNSKPNLVRQIVSLALNGDKEATRLQATIWALERFPEFAPKAINTQQTNVVVVNKEDTIRQEKVMDKMQELLNTIKTGDNPYVIDNYSKDTSNTDKDIPVDNTGPDTHTS